MPRCTGCGAWVDEDEEFCDRCGVKIPDDAPDDRWRTREDSDSPSRGATEEPEAGRARPEREQRPPQRREPAFRFLLRQPLRGGRRPLVLSAALVLGSPLVVPVLALLGYCHRLGRSVALGAAQPPAYGDWGRLVVDGLRLLLVAVVPSLLWAVGVVAVTVLLLFALPFAGGLVVLTALFGLLGLVWLTGAYLAAFAGSDSVAGAFLDGRVRRLLSGDGYLNLWLLVVLFALPLLVAVLVVSGPLYLVVTADVSMVLAGLLGPLALTGLAVILAYAALVGATYTGYLYYRMADKKIVPDPAGSKQQLPGGGRAETTR